MNCPDLGAFWSQNKQRIGTALPEGAGALAEILQEGAGTFSLRQEVDGRYVHWKDREGRSAVVFCVVPDPRDLDAVRDVYVRAKTLQPTLMVVFVHQWTDGEGNWDAFAITPKRAIQHGDRIRGSDAVQERGPKLRDDIYTLFACDREFPEPGRAEWAELLAGPVERVVDRLGILAGRHGCTQNLGDYMTQWLGPEGRVEAQFFFLPDPGPIDAYIAIYEKIRETRCPVSFVFVKRDEFRVYDIFRLSARSYLEHHNQARGIVRAKRSASGQAKTIEDLRWIPRWASHVGCIKGCLNHLGVDVSDAWLFGATGHAFVLNISDGLCPSGPTDWGTERFLKLGRNVGYVVEGVDEWYPKNDDRLARAQKEAWDYVRNCIDEGTPCYGWELIHPDYFVIYGYDEDGYYVSGPGCDDGAGPVPWQRPGASEIGMVRVSSVRSAEPAEVGKTVREALSYAVDVGRNRVKWTDRAGGLAGYDLWIKTMEQGKAGRFGLGYNATVWAESRRFAVEFLREAKGRLDGGLALLFEKAIAQYAIVAARLKTVSNAFPFKQCEDGFIEADAHAQTVIEALKDAREAEAAGLTVLAELAARLD